MECHPFFWPRTLTNWLAVHPSAGRRDLGPHARAPLPAPQPVPTRSGDRLTRMAKRAPPATTPSHRASGHPPRPVPPSRPDSRAIVTAPSNRQGIRQRCLGRDLTPSPATTAGHRATWGSAQFLYHTRFVYHTPSFYYALKTQSLLNFNNAIDTLADISFQHMITQFQLRRHFSPTKELELPFAICDAEKWAVPITP